MNNFFVYLYTLHYGINFIRYLTQQTLKKDENGEYYVNFNEEDFYLHTYQGTMDSIIRNITGLDFIKGKHDRYGEIIYKWNELAKEYKKWSI